MGSQPQLTSQPQLLSQQLLQAFLQARLAFMRANRPCFLGLQQQLSQQLSQPQDGAEQQPLSQPLSQPQLGSQQALQPPSQPQDGASQQLSQPQAGSQQLLQAFLAARLAFMRANRPCFLGLQQQGSQHAGAQLSQPQLGAQDASHPHDGAAQQPPRRLNACALLATNSRPMARAAGITIRFFIG